MTVPGHVKNGVIVPDQPIELPEGAAVEIQLRGKTGSAQDRAEEAAMTLHERMKPFIGAAKNLPPDLSVNHDHYLYGTEKRS